MPPLKPLVKGVRIASVMTTSSGFFWVLFTVHGQQMLPELWWESGLHCGQSALAGGEMVKDRAESFGCHDV